MLYKKYHRNFVKQFKKGVEFEYMYLDDNGRNENVTITAHICCTGKPMIGQTRWDNSCCIQIPVSRDDYCFGYHSKFTLVYSDGIIVDVEIL